MTTQRILLGIILPLFLIAAVGGGVWAFVRWQASNSNQESGTAVTDGTASGALKVVNVPTTAENTLPEEVRTRVSGSMESVSRTPENRATVPDEIVVDEKGNEFTVRGTEEPVPPPPQTDPTIVPIPRATAGSGGTATPVLSGSEDTDGDGLTTDQELQQGTSPQRADTDNDGLTDGDEVRQYRTSPTNPDTDGDGLGDGEEVIRWGTDPLNPDTDGDTYLDGAEIQAGYNPNGPGAL